MAFVWKHPQSQYWIARFFDIHGKRRNRSTRSTSRKEAERIAASFEVVAKKKRTVRQVREVIAALHKEITGDDLHSQSLREFSASWLERKSAEVAPATLAFYRNVSAKFMTFLDTKADAEISEITTEDVVSFRNHQAKTLGSKTVNHDLKGLRMLFHAARRDRVITEDPCEFVNQTKSSESTARRPFTIPELQAVLSVAGDEWKSLILCGIYTGQRLGDIAMLTWQKVDLLRGEIHLVTGKNGKIMILPIAAHLRKHLETLPATHKPDEPLHPSAFAIVSKNGRTGGLSNQFAALLVAAGLRDKQTHRKKANGLGRSHKRAPGGLGFHCLRHTAVSLLKDAGIPSAVVMEMIGHDSKQMSQHYTHVGREALEKAAASLPALL